MQPYGGFWWRVLAYFIDAIILQIGSSIIGGFMGAGIGASMAMMRSGQESIVSTAMLMAILLTLVLQWLYFALMESSAMQATVGKLAIGLVVTDLNGNRISFGRATGRYFAKILSGVILLIGFIMVAFTERKQGLHDMIAGTLVWKTRDPRLVRNDESIFV
ncbi:RDD family protein [Novosphingobium sp.]|uniref:RDD family protein n=1 Tax=Novosphingobium sp. TaxID=1874826 RepID=UPI002B477CE9|nr:RDD family protein [Novosphingobium sp.]HKR90934.1 RDD family protein [Novosphingobium sp.]